MMVMTCNTGDAGGKGRSCRREVEGEVGVGQMNIQYLITIVTDIIIFSIEYENDFEEDDETN